MARDAGVSHQTLLNHFGSKEGLYVAAVERVGVRIGEIRAAAVPGDVSSIVSALMDQYERFGDGNARAAALDERSPAVGAMLAGARAYHQQWLAEMFAATCPRPAAHGVGLRLRPSASTSAVAKAVRRLIYDPSFSRAAARFGDAIRADAQHATAVDEIEGLSRQALPA